MWPDTTNATWMYKGTDVSDASTVIRVDQVEVQVIVTKGSQLIMTFTVTDTGGRVSGLSGSYSFNLKSSV